MNLIFCLDDKNGILFNRRRQSRDSVLLSDALRLAGGRLWITPFSQKIFESASLPHEVTSDPTSLEGNEWLFYEGGDPAPLFPLCREIVVYRWNETYPSDVRVSLDTLLGGEAEAEMEGSSHKKITRHRYVPK